MNIQGLCGIALIIGAIVFGLIMLPGMVGDVSTDNLPAEDAANFTGINTIGALLLKFLPIIGLAVVVIGFVVVWIIK